MRPIIVPELYPRAAPKKAESPGTISTATKQNVEKL
jgi:hypothetical protein